ncbi:MAG: dihydroneopterin aldolase [Alphaproteobacteria bacterium]|nr:MAG: dihydroneopterin aldolase [Alphaproteobacteria bacterium]
MTGNVHPLNIASAAQSLRHVFVRDLTLDASIGIYDHEREGAQPVRINIDLTVLEAATDLGDNIQNVVCYEEVVKKVKGIIASGHIHLVETLAEQIAENCLLDERVKVARVRVEKLTPIPEASSVGVEIERIRS